MTQAFDNQPPAANGPPTDSVQFRLAYEQTAAERAALAEEDLLTIMFDVTSAVHTAIGALSHIAGLRAQMGSLPVDLNLIDRVGLYAHAAGYAHALYVISIQPPAELQAVYESALLARAQLRSDAGNLALFGVINGEVLENLKGDTGHRNVGYDLLSLVAVHREAKSRSEGRTAVPAQLLEEYELLASRLLDMVAKRETQLKEQTDVVSQRRRSATLLANAYDEARRAVTFLRWKQDDVERLTPSLYATKGAGRPKSTAQPSATASQAASDDAGPNGSAAPQAPAAEAAAASDPNLPAGARGGNPFR